MFEKSYNKDYKSYEIKFDSIPSEKVRQLLKENGYKWHGVRKLWFGYKDIDLEEKAVKTAIKASEAQKVTRLNNVKVGDVFSASWGYEQTNINFFQVVALVGASRVRIVEVSPAKFNESWVQSMARDIDSCTDFKPLAKSHFVTDQVKGDLKEIKGTKENPYFLAGHSYQYQPYCTPYHGEKLYESFYA